MINKLINKTNIFITMNGIFMFLLIFVAKTLLYSLYFNHPRLDASVFQVGISAIFMILYVLISIYGGEIILSTLFSLKNEINKNNIFFLFIFNTLFWFLLIYFSYDEFQPFYAIMYVLQQMLGFFIGSPYTKYLKKKIKNNFLVTMICILTMIMSIIIILKFDKLIYI